METLGTVTMKCWYNSVFFKTSMSSFVLTVLLRMVRLTCHCILNYNEAQTVNTAAKSWRL